MASNLAWIVLLTMLAIPLYLHAAGWEATAGKFGWIPLVQGGTRFWFRGLLAASWIHGTYGACWVTMATILGLRSVPKSIHQLTHVDGGGGRITWFVQLPIVLPWVVAAAIWNCVIAATEMTVADLYGVRTVADDVYKVYALRPESVSMLLTSWIPIAIVAITLWTLASRRYDAATWRKWLGEGRYGESSEHAALQSRLIDAPWQQGLDFRARSPYRFGHRRDTDIRVSSKSGLEHRGNCGWPASEFLLARLGRDAGSRSWFLRDGTGLDVTVRLLLGTLLVTHCLGTGEFRTTQPMDPITHALDLRFVANHSRAGDQLLGGRVIQSA